MSYSHDQMFEEIFDCEHALVCRLWSKIQVFKIIHFYVTPKKQNWFCQKLVFPII
jgi:hypothetical protein